MSVSAKRNARIELTSSAAGMDRGLNDARRKLRAFEREQVREARKAKREAEKASKDRRKRVSGFAVGAGGAVADRAIDMFTDGLSGVHQYEKALTRLQITAESQPETMAALSRSIMKTSNATGIARNEVIAATSAFVAAGGSIDVASDSTATWAKIAQGTDTTIQDVVSSAVAMNKQLGIGAPDMETAFSAMAAQAKRGNIELKDMASELAVIAPQWASFQGGKGVEGIRELGAALQVVKGGFGGDAGETITGMQSLLTALIKNASRLKDGGVKVFEMKGGKKELRNVLDIVTDIGNSKLAKDKTILLDAFGRVEAYRAYLQLSQNKGMLKDLIEVARDGQVIQRDFDTYMNSSAGKMEAAWTRVKNLIANAFTADRIEGFSRAIDRLPEKLEPVIAILSKIGAVFGGLYGVGKSIRGMMPGGDGQERVGGVDALILAGRRKDASLVTGGNGYMSDEEYERRRATAQQNLRGVKAYNSALENIFGAEIDEKTSPESIRRAFAQKYNTLAIGEGSLGASSAGSTYLKRAGVSDPAEVARKTMADVSATAAQLKTIAQVRDAIKQGFADIGIHIGNEPIQKGAANSVRHRRGH